LSPPTQHEPETSVRAFSDIPAPDRPKSERRAAETVTDTMLAAEGMLRLTPDVVALAVKSVLS